MDQSVFADLSDLDTNRELLNAVTVGVQAYIDRGSSNSRL